MTGRLDKPDTMLKRALTYFLLMLIVLQSGLAMTDAHQLHQSGSEHVAFDIDHQHLDGLDSEKNNGKDVDSDASSSQKWDCHHCCHCHGHFSPTILISTEHILFSKHSSPIPTYSENTFPDAYEAFLRPPKA
jgi:hypothetical protein